VKTSIPALVANRAPRNIQEKHPQIYPNPTFWAAGQPAFVTGWGDIAEGAGAFPDALRVGSVAIADDLACADSYAAVGTTVRPDTMLCASRTGGGVDTCQGDSGGPMVVPVSGGGFRLVGDTSFGIGCARPEFPGVYGRLADDP
jgi:hypothetical protein